MSPPSNRTPTCPPPDRAAGETAASRAPRPRVYGKIFWMAYVANVTVVTGNGLSFRFAELVEFAGGTEQTAGLVVSVAMATALSARLFLGQAIDRHGVRRLWLLAASLFIAGGTLLTLTDEISWQIYLARALFALGVSGTLTCSAVHIQTLVPARRRTEILASLGSSGFVGMILGSFLGDLIFWQIEGRLRFLVLFGGATLLGMAYLVFVWQITKHDDRKRAAVSPAIHHLLIRYWPGNILSVAFVMGMSIAVTTVFLTRYVTWQGMSGIGPFFIGYATSAFIFRLSSRTWSRAIGRHRMILMGLAGYAVALFTLPLATTSSTIVLPAICGGFGHALLFPATVSLGAESFPRKFRGTGTTVVMGFFEVGIVVSAPILGTIIEAFDGHGFTPMFLFAGSVATAVALIYAVTTARTADSDLIPQEATTPQPPSPGGAPIASPVGRHSSIEPAPPRPASPSESTKSGRKAVVVPRDDRPPASPRERAASGVRPPTRCR